MELLMYKVLNFLWKVNKKKKKTYLLRHFDKNMTLFNSVIEGHENYLLNDRLL